MERPSPLTHRAEPLACRWRKLVRIHARHQGQGLRQGEADCRPRGDRGRGLTGSSVSPTHSRPSWPADARSASVMLPLQPRTIYPDYILTDSGLQYKVRLAVSPRPSAGWAACARLEARVHPHRQPLGISRRRNGSRACVFPPGHSRRRCVMRIRRRWGSEQSVPTLFPNAGPCCGHRDRDLPRQHLHHRLGRARFLSSLGFADPRRRASGLLRGILWGEAHVRGLLFARRFPACVADTPSDTTGGRSRRGTRPAAAPSRAMRRTT